METNADSTTHLFHNKFIVIDDKVVFNGAGNFTSASLNTFGLGNMEQFYIIKIPELVQAYSKGWDTLHFRSTKATNHPVGSQPEKGIKCNGGLCDFTF
jgi:phosphatidylserine/phosphatidylglycerophosphate/cardiolipin synthase-like enzyme